MNLEDLSHIISSLPANEREAVGNMTITEFQQTHLKESVKEKIQDYFVALAKEQTSLAKFKRQLGFCVTPYCLNTSTQRKCNECNRQYRNSKHSNRVSEYGKIRRQEKKER